MFPITNATTATVAPSIRYGDGGLIYEYVLWLDVQG